MYRDDEDIRQLAERLKIARKARGLTQEQVAELTQVSQSAISLYELGRREPYIITAKRLAIAYGVTIDWLMGISNAGGPVDDWEPGMSRAIGGRGRDVVADVGELMDLAEGDDVVEDGGDEREAPSDFDDYPDPGDSYFSSGL